MPTERQIIKRHLISAVTAIDKVKGHLWDVAAHLEEFEQYRDACVLGVRSAEALEEHVKLLQVTQP